MALGMGTRALRVPLSFATRLDDTVPTGLPLRRGGTEPFEQGPRSLRQKPVERLVTDLD